MRLLLFIAVALPQMLFAQGWREGVAVILDTTALRIGEQVTLTLSVQYRRTNLPMIVQWPTIGDTLSAHIEVVTDPGIDTLPSPDMDNAYVQERKLRLTSFDTGYWAIPPFHFELNGRAMETEPMLLQVQGVELDSTLAPRDIKDIYELPFSLTHWMREHWKWIACGACVLALAALILWLVLRKKKQAPVKEVPVIEIPIDRRTIEALHALEKQRLWQNGEHKAYYSRLTDLVRGYIEERYRVPALESTTDELLQELRVSPLTDDQRSRLSNMLHLADMVKFAKTIPSPIDNEQMMSGALRFVEETAVQPTPASHAS